MKNRNVRRSARFNLFVIFVRRHELTTTADAPLTDLLDLVSKEVDFLFFAQHFLRNAMSRPLHL